MIHAMVVILTDAGTAGVAGRSRWSDHQDPAALGNPDERHVPGRHRLLVTDRGDQGSLA